MVAEVLTLHVTYLKGLCPRQTCTRITHDKRVIARYFDEEDEEDEKHRITGNNVVITVVGFLFSEKIRLRNRLYLLYFL